MRYLMLITLLPIFWNEEQHCQGHQHKCLNVITPQFNSCLTLQPHPSSVEKCSKDDVCQKEFNFTLINMAPFAEILYNIVKNVFNICCGACKELSGYKAMNVSITDFSRELMNKSHFVFPILGFHSSTRIYGYHFIPILELSSGYYVTQEHTRTEIMRRLIISCANLWPLLVIMLLLSLIAGFFIWILETWMNQEEFPRMFFIGLFDGFWWSFVSMTTVGYGDKIPKFAVSRLFSVIWILIGITICSLFTASLTNEITSASSPENPDMHGRNVGVLRYRTFDASVIAKHGGVLRETKGQSTNEDIVELKRMIREKGRKINGFFMDKYTFMYTTRYAIDIHNKVGHIHNVNIDDAEFFLEQTVKTKKSFEGEKMAYGILVKDEDDYIYFNEFIKDNQAIFEICTTLDLNVMNHIIQNPEHDLFSPKGGHFYPTLIATGCTVGAMLIFGIVFELCRRKRIKPIDVPT